MKLILAVFLGGLLATACVEVKRKDADENRVMANAVSDTLYFSGDVDISEDLLRNYRASRIGSEDDAWLIEADKIEFAPDTKVIANGHDLVFRAPTIKVGARTSIETFPTNRTARFATNGKNGSRIVFSADHIEGEITAVFRGENGGQGLPGKDPDAALQGEPGAPGRNGICTGSGGKQPYTGQVAINVSCSPSTFGREGKNGKPGYPGDQGFQGGNGGEIIIHANDQAHLLCRIKSNEPGNGGEGGKGGNGGAPGVQGTNGHSVPDANLTNLWSQYYNSYPEEFASIRDENGWVTYYAMTGEPKASIGPQGPTGEKGLSGQPGKYVNCLNL